MIPKSFEQSFASNIKSNSWSSKNILTPREVSTYSNKKFLFNCSCGHEFESVLSSVSRGKWCPFCCSPPIRLCDNQECQSCFEKSFASSEKIKFWSKNNTLKPRDVFMYAHKKILFNCSCGHEFESSLCNVSSGKWCGYCSNRKLCTNDECQICFEKSFASSEKMQFWSNENKLRPRDVFKHSNIKRIFNCSCGNVFEKSLNHISNESWCPVCVNKTEKKIFQIIQRDYPEIKNQLTKNWCRNPETKRYLPFDFALENEKIIIELDGRQHFVLIPNRSSPEEQHQRDIYKMKCAEDNGYSVIRITQEDVLYDTFDWYKFLKESIETIIRKGTVETHYISLNGEYDSMFYK